VRTHSEIREEDMSEASEIRALIKKIAHGGEITVFTAEVTEIGNEYCSVVLGGLTLTKVKNFCIESAGNLYIKPKLNSIVTIVDLGDMRDMQIIKVQDIDQIIFNNGNNGGLINISDLTSKLNALVSEVKAMKQDYIIHTHPVPALGTSSAPTVPYTGTFSQFNKSDFEDTNVKH
jgi:hypothetical protein